MAHGAALEEVFTAVAVEASALLGDHAAALLRYDADGSATTVATCGTRAPRGSPARAVTAEGRGIALPITVEGRVWGALAAGTASLHLPAGTEERLAQFAGLAAAAIATPRTKAQLTASRARVVATADETRRRLQRDVHDGAQQRLVQTIITLKLARAAAAQGGPAADLLDEALYHAERANAELRDLVHGILPAALIQGGLRTGLDALIDDMTLPVVLRFAAPALPIALETTAYFVVAEAPTNVVKHARATQAQVSVDVRAGMLSVDVRDDGIGGAGFARGTGLIGLSDRVEAANGTLTLASPADGGTTLHASLPFVAAARPNH